MISRRSFLAGVSAAPVLGGWSDRVAVAAKAPKNSIVVFDNITAGTDAAHLGASLRSCALAGVPVTCLVNIYSSARLASSSPIIDVLRKARTNYGGLVEICAFVPNLGQLSPYFQSRAAFEAHRVLGDLLQTPGSGGQPGNFPRLMGTEHTPEATAPLGLRSAGIRTILARPPETKAIRSEAWEEGIVRIIGGVRLHATSQGVLSDIETASEQIYYVSMETSATSDQAEANSSLNALLTAVRPSQSNDWRAPILAADAGFRDNYQYRRMLSIHLTGDKRSEGLNALQSNLQQLNIPYTTSPTISGNLMDGQSDLWLPYDIDNSVQLSSEPVRATSYFRTETRETAVSAGRLREIPISFRSVGEHHLGFDRSGTLGLRSLKIEAGSELRDLSLQALGVNDLTLVVNRTSMETEYHRRLLTNTLQSVRESGFTDIVPLYEQGRAIVPFDSVFEHHRRTSAYQRAAPQIINAAPPNDRDALFKDAKLAWSYFEKWTNPETGLCPATVHSNGQNSILHKAVTMWDVGSHINALIAAHRLELISTKSFRKAVQKLQPNLAGRRSQGRLLPQGWIVTDRIKWGVKDFDGCDAGRLLSSLYSLDAYGIAGQVAEPIVESWDLQEIIRDGIIHSVTDGELVSTYKSHCAHYAAWAFRVWGMNTLSPYEAQLSKVDAEMALLDTAARIGPLGAEPLLLEALELEMSPESAFLADTLFAAQLEERRDTGSFTCVSESPIDQDPWFVYSGLDLSKKGRVWATDTVESLPEHRTPKFAQKNMTLSTKAAYLWYAYNQHEYAAALIEQLRPKTETRYGFRSGVYQVSKEPTQNTDLNTNAIILQSISKIISDTL